MIMDNEFEALGQQYSSQTASDGTKLYYEESRAGSGRWSAVYIRDQWVFCPSHELMHPQAVIDGLQRGSRAMWQGCHGTVLSVYRVNGHARACVMLDARNAADDREGVPLSELTPVA